MNFIFQNEKMFIQTDIDEDTQKRKRDNIKRNKKLINGGADAKPGVLLEEDFVDIDYND